MIRDPSDGTVRDHHAKPLETKPYASKSDDLITTALAPLPKDAKIAAQLQKSREWLKAYHNPVKEEGELK